MITRHDTHIYIYGYGWGGWKKLPPDPLTRNLRKVTPPCYRLPMYRVGVEITWGEAATPELAPKSNDALEMIATGRPERFAYYGRTPEWYVAKLWEQGGGCALCGYRPRNMWALAVDHSHWVEETHGVENSVRDLLCNECNYDLGFVENRGVNRLTHRTDRWIRYARAYIRDWDQKLGAY